MTSMTDSLLQTLDAVASRLRWRRITALGGVVASSILVVVAVVIVLGAILAPTGVARWPLYAGGVAILFFLGYLVADARHAVSREEAAVAADRAAGLQDELSSALWFTRHPDERSAFVDAHLRKAETTAAGMDARALVPWRMPASGWSAVALLGVVAVVAMLAPRFTPHFGEHDFAQAAVDAAKRGAAVAPDSLAEDLSQGSDAATKDRLARTLAALDDPKKSLEERRKALEAARELVAQRALEAAAARERMKAIAESLADRAGYEEVAQALKEGDARQAADALRKQLGTGADGSGSERKETPADAEAGVDQAKVDEMADALQAAAQNGSSERGAEAQRNLARAVQNLDEIARSVEATEGAGHTARRLDAMTTELKREANLRAARFGQRNGAGQATPGPETGESNMKGGSMFRLGAVAQERRNPGKDSNRAGDASGNAQGDPVVGDEVRRIRAKFKRETVKDRDSGSESGEDSGKFAASRAAESKVAYRDVDSRYRRVGEEALSAERIALRHRAQVKGFFTDNGESAQ